MTTAAAAVRLARIRSPLLPRWRPGRVLLVFGLGLLLFICWVFGATGLQHDRAQRDLRVRFDAALQAAPRGATITSTDGEPTVLPAHDWRDPVALLQIPALEIAEVVVEGTRNADLTHGPGHLRASVMPGEVGNAIIMGRRTTYGAPFRHLDDLALDAPIRVSTEAGTFVYAVTGVRVADLESLGDLAVTEGSRLTLLTSTPDYAPSGLLVVEAELVGDAVPASRARPVGVDTDESGLTGEPIAVVALVGTLQLLLVSAVAVSWMWKRWSRRSTWLLATPVVAVTTLLTFESLQRLLPATL